MCLVGRGGEGRGGEGRGRGGKQRNKDPEDEFQECFPHISSVLVCEFAIVAKESGYTGCLFGGNKWPKLHHVAPANKQAM